MRSSIIFGVIATTIAAACLLSQCGCRRAKGNAVAVIGSTSIHPFAEVLAQDFNARHPGVNVEPQGVGSTAGLQAVSDGTADIGMCSRGLKPEENQYVPIEIALDGLAVVVKLDQPDSPGNTWVNNLTTKQIAEIFSGRKTNWKDFGGPDKEIHVITREEGSGTREAFQKMVMHEERIYRRAVTQESNGAVKELVRNDEAAIGYMSLGLVNGELKILRVGGVTPSARTVRDKTYPLVRPFLFVLKKGAPEKTMARAFIDFVLSKEGQVILEKEGLVGVYKNP